MPLQLKELLSERNEGVAVAQLCLIFAGKILKDEEPLEKQGVKDGLTIHLVIRSAPKVRENGGTALPLLSVHCLFILCSLVSPPALQIAAVLLQRARPLRPHPLLLPLPLPLLLDRGVPLS